MRQTLLTALVGLLVVSSGCLGLLTGQTVAFEAERAGVSDAALETTGYEQTGTETRTISRNVEFGGQQRTINVTNHVGQYARVVDFGPLGQVNASRLIVVSTPGAQVAGQTLNPAASWSNRRVIEQVAQRSGQIRDVSFVGNRSVQSLGEARNVGEFTGTTTIQGQEVDVLLHVASFEHQGDVIVLVAVYPEQIDEQDNVDTLIGGLQHPV